MTSKRIEVGRRGEELAVAYLLGLGMRLRGRNFRIRGGPEIDIVAQDDDTLVFVEVRARSRPDEFSPIDSIDARKQEQVRRAVRSWLRASGWDRDQPVRIDVIGVTFEAHGARLEHIADAF